jgi:aldehyde dehydrogenase (NAD+)
MSATIRSCSPQRPTDILGQWPAATARDVDRAVELAQAAGLGWAAASAHERSACLVAASERVQDAAVELADLAVREVGKPITEAGGEVARTIAILRYYAQAALDPDGETLPAADGRSLLIARRRPRGVAALICPWNFPFAIPVWKAAPALAWGNAVVLKPSPEATACAMRLGELLALPDGVLQILPGDQHAGSALVAHPEVDVVSFTGSAGVGRQVVVDATAAGSVAQAEMGGSNASVVLADADVAAAARTIAGAAMGFAGQKCTATSRVIAVGGDRLREALMQEIRSLVTGDPADPATVVGPVIDDGARRRVLSATRDAVAAGARLLLGEPHAEGDAMVAPVLLDRIDPRASSAQDEVFGPFCVLLEADDDDHALRLANETRYGLAAAVFTADLERALRFADGLEAGMVRVNGPTTGVDFHAPFGGTKHSSHGPREQGRAARDLYTTTRTITVSSAA